MGTGGYGLRPKRPYERMNVPFAEHEAITLLTRTDTAARYHGIPQQHGEADAKSHFHPPRRNAALSNRRRGRRTRSRPFARRSGLGGRLCRPVAASASPLSSHRTGHTRPRAFHPRRRAAYRLARDNPAVENSSLSAPAGSRKVSTIRASSTPPSSPPSSAKTWARKSPPMRR